MNFSGFDLSTIQDVYVGGVGFSYIYYGSNLVWQKSTPPVPVPYDEQYFTMEALEDGTFVFNKTGSPGDTYYSTDGTNWTLLSNGDTISVNTGDKVFFKRDTSTGSYSTSNYINFGASAEFDVYGNIESLVYGDNFLNKTDLNGKSYILYGLFVGNGKLKNANNLILPATTLANNCYHDMFSGCSSLVTAPELPATTLANNCYQGMFIDCSSLTTAPELPATTLASGCYSYMFLRCTSLTTAPELPATTLANNCYQDMFNGCSSLVTAPILPAATLVSNCYSGMFYNCKSLNYIKCLATNISASRCTNNWVISVASQGTFVKDYDMSSWSRGGSGIPYSWTVQNVGGYYSQYLTIEAKESGSLSLNRSGTTPDVYYSTDDGSTWSIFTNSISLSNGTKVLLKRDATNGSFDTSLNLINFSSTANFDVYGNIQSLIYDDNFINTSDLNNKDSVLAYLFYNNPKLQNVQNLVLPATTLTGSCYTYMFADCSSLTAAPALPATTLASSCYARMFSGCTSLTTAPTLSATTLASSCYAGMFEGCSSLTTAPTLSATTSVSGCYQAMFKNCTLLNTITCNLTNIQNNSDTLYWVQGVAATGTFNRNQNMYNWPIGDNGIPAGWLINPALPYEYQYLTIEALENGQITCTKTGSPTDIYYSTDNSVTWSALSTLSVSQGDKVLLKRDTSTSTYDDSNYQQISSTAQFNVYGNIESLVYSDNFKNKTDLNSKTYIFNKLFENNNKLISAEHLILPATTLAQYCYHDMFYDCTSLTTAPELPATTLQEGVYSHMFYGCSSLSTAPELPATTLAQYCYTFMFYGCSSLSTAPELHATTLTDYCYNYMFSGCTSLNYVMCYATSNSANYCTHHWLENVASSGTFYKDSTATWTSDVSGIPYSWTVLDIPAHWVVEYIQHDSSHMGRLDLGVVPNTTMKFEIKFSTDSNSGSSGYAYFGQMSSNGTALDDSRDFRLFVYQNKYYFDAQSYRIISGSTITFNTFHTVELGNNYITDLDTSQTWTASGTYSSIYYTTIPLYLFWQNDPSTLRFAYVKIYDNNVLIHNYIPVLYNNEYTMYDQITDTYCTVSGTLSGGNPV